LYQEGIFVKKHRPLWVWSVAAASCVSAFAAVKPASDYGKLPLTFEANAGQTDGRVRYLSRGAGYTLFLTAENEAVVSLARTTSKGERQTAAVRMSMPGSKRASAIHALEPQANISNYYYGSDPKGWLTGVRHYGRVSYKGVYPGIDVVYYGNQRQLEYDFVVSPGANPKDIRLKFDGADRIATASNGDLVLHTQYGEIRQRRPVVYQDVDGQRRFIAATYKVDVDHQAFFSLGTYDRSKKLTIDPILVYSTFLGGTGVENGSAIAVDAAQAAYVVGSTASSNFPVITGLNGQTSFRGGAYDAFVVKYAPAGNAIVFSTYIGGAGYDAATGVGVDSAGNIVVTGDTDSPTFPLRNPLQAQIGGKIDAFLLKIGAQGGLIYSTFLGGFEDDHALGLAVDSDGNAVVSGATRSTNFWSLGGLRPVFMGGLTDGWVFKMKPEGLIAWATYLGGNGNDSANAVALDPAGDIYVTGDTTSLNFPATAGAMRTVLFRPGSPDAFVTKIKGDGTAFGYSTYLGGTNNDTGIGIAADGQGNAYITGNTDSVDFPVVNPLQGPPGNGDVFVTKLNPAGSAPVYSTFLAGSGLDRAADIKIDGLGNAYVYGSTASDNFPASSALQSVRIGGQDLFVAKINAAGTARDWATYLGGASDDAAARMAIDANANLYLTGSTTSTDFPSVQATQVSIAGAQDAFLTKIGGCDISLTPTTATFNPTPANGSFTVNSLTCPWVAASNDSWITVTGTNSGTTTGIVTYSITQNPGITRTGSISISGLRFTITQAGLTTVAPSVIALTPGSGAGNSQVFAAKYSTANPGGSNIDHTYLLLNTSINGTNGCMVEFTPATNVFRLINNDGVTWTAPAAAGSGAVLSNSQCSLNAATSSGATTSGVGALETNVNYSLTFTGPFAGLKNTYLLALSDSGLNSGWIQAGTWTVGTGGGGGGGGGLNGVESLIPTTGAGSSGTFSGVFTHTGGATQHYLGYMLFLPTPNVVNFTATGSCLVEYNRISNGMRLIDNAGTGWIGGIEGIRLGTPGAVLDNSFCTVNVQSATALVAGTQMTVNVPIVFKPALGPVLGSFLQAEDVNGLWTGMTQFGNWVLPGAPLVRTGPAIASILPTTATGSAANYTITATHPGGPGALTQVHLLLSDKIVGGTPCQAVYFPGSNTINLINDAGNGLVSPTGVVPGSAVILSNSRCGVNVAGATVAATANSVAVTLPMTFSSATFGGIRNVYGIAFDNTGLTSHWVRGATLIVQ
jgi:hypothetical protein